MTNKYAMATITHGRRFYWSKTINGWSVWHDASHYTEDERKKAKLPRNAFWVSVLRGMGANPYPADGVLNDPPAEYLAQLPKPKVTQTDPRPAPILRKPGGVIHTPKVTDGTHKGVKRDGRGRKRP